MSNVIFAIPVATAEAHRAEDTFAKWQRMGYMTAAIVDRDLDVDIAHCDMIEMVDVYKGWAWAVNLMCRRPLLACVDYVVTGGADVWPDPVKTAFEIAEECTRHFGGTTYGVMQPAGDRYGAIPDKAACVSPWLGRDWCRKAYGGKGPLHEGYPHYFADADLLFTAEAQGRLWWREDLNQYHDHYLRKHSGTPPHLDKWQDTHRASKALFERRKAEGFPDAY